MTIKLNQHLSKTVPTKTEQLNFYECGIYRRAGVWYRSSSEVVCHMIMWWCIFSDCLFAGGGEQAERWELPYSTRDRRWWGFVQYYAESTRTQVSLKIGFANKNYLRPSSGIVFIKTWSAAFFCLHCPASYCQISACVSLNIDNITFIPSVYSLNTPQYRHTNSQVHICQLGRRYVCLRQHFQKSVSTSPDLNTENWASEYFISVRSIFRDTQWFKDIICWNSVFKYHKTS